MRPAAGSRGRVALPPLPLGVSARRYANRWPTVGCLGVDLATRLLRGSDVRRTRFHSQRGELIDGASWLHLPRAVTRRLLRRVPKEPWLVPGAVRFLRRRIGADWKVLEFGSGYSTAWYGRRAAQVLSFEDDAEWHRQTSGELRWPADCTVELMGCERMLEQVADLPSAHFDLAVVDTSALRVELAAAARRTVKPGGLLVFDDFDRYYAEAEPLFDGWVEHRFVGIKGTPMTAAETAVFERAR
jgi:SAM-dependent methyltransferase